jgi:octaprenyl-diphosphate synthase
VGAILGGASEEKEKYLSEFGMHMGIAFQLIDDLLDYTSKEVDFVKKIGIDLQDGKITLPLIFTLHQCTAEERAFIQRTVDSPLITKDAFLEMVKIIERSSRSPLYLKAKEYVDRQSGPPSCFPVSKERDASHAMADYILERKL